MKATPNHQTDCLQAAATNQTGRTSHPSMQCLLDKQIPDSLLRLGVYLRKRKVAQALLGSPLGTPWLTTLETESGPYLCSMTSCGIGRKGWLERIFLPLDGDGQTKRRILGVQGWRRVVSIHLYLLGLESARFLKRYLGRRCCRNGNSWSSPPCVKWLVGAFQSSTRMEKIKRGRG